ncbi:hypothetical protein ALC57_07826 [Trachymyrmex cornetzi]|uniref:Uncharacterized protein n=1 Tax=Trachymyrmex cornetzi TaxID=471704 RepID=A0A195E3X3_9HYME|nr:hypothetical protein ALC57_07826 [Trachymyrmex cornetzi]
MSLVQIRQPVGPGPNILEEASELCEPWPEQRRVASATVITGELTRRDGRRTFFEEGRGVGSVVTSSSGAPSCIVKSSSSNSGDADGDEEGGGSSAGAGGGGGDGGGGGSVEWWWWIAKMMVGWSDGGAGAPSAQAVPSDADAVTGAQRDPTQLDLTSHIRSRIKRRGLGKWSACACVRTESVGSERKRERRGAEERKEGKISQGENSLGPPSERGV